MRRREFITLLGGAATVWPLVSAAQPSKKPVRLGFVPIGSPESPYDGSLVEALRQGLRKVGFVENQNVVLDVAWVKSDPGQTVSDVLQRGADVLIPAVQVHQRRRNDRPRPFPLCLSTLVTL